MARPKKVAEGNSMVVEKEKAEVKPTKLVPEITPSMASPKLVGYSQNRHSDTVSVRTSDGNIMQFSPSAAQRLVRKNPDKFKIV